jgi:hypothetical protein
MTLYMTSLHFVTSLHFNIGYGRKRYRSPRKRTLSTRKIFSNKSARAQANQIYSLRKSVSSLARRNRPEKKVYLSDSVGTTFYSPASPSYASSYLVGTQAIPPQGTDDHQRIGDAIRIISFKVYLSFEFFLNAAQNTSGGALRVIILQLKSGQTYPALDDLLVYQSDALDASYNLQSKSPFKNGITTGYRICYDRTWKCNPFNNAQC